MDQRFHTIASKKTSSKTWSNPTQLISQTIKASPSPSSIPKTNSSFKNQEEASHNNKCKSQAIKRWINKQITKAQTKWAYKINKNDSRIHSSWVQTAKTSSTIQTIRNRLRTKTPSWARETTLLSDRLQRRPQTPPAQDSERSQAQSTWKNCKGNSLNKTRSPKQQPPSSAASLTRYKAASKIRVKLPPPLSVATK